MRTPPVTRARSRASGARVVPNNPPNRRHSSASATPLPSARNASSTAKLGRVLGACHALVRHEPN